MAKKRKRSSVRCERRSMLASAHILRAIALITLLADKQRAKASSFMWQEHAGGKGSRRSRVAPARLVPFWLVARKCDEDNDRLCKPLL